MSRGAAVAGALLYGSQLVACSDCPGYGVTPHYRVVVLDAATEQRICDAQLFVDESPAVAPENCAHVVPIPEAKEYVVLRAERAGYTPASEQVTTTYRSDSCGIAVPVDVDLRLEKAQ